MNYFSYKLDHDYGLAPNPFHGYCTLAVCKSNIRGNKNLAIGDWIIGTGSKALGNINRLIYAMRVGEKLTFDDYWMDKRFQQKKPVLNGSLVLMYGDNIYHTDPKSKKWVQENSAHSTNNTTYNVEHLERDTNGQYVLVSQEFYYFGDDAPVIPDEFKDVCCNGRDFKYAPSEVAKSFIDWLINTYEPGIHGDPVSWAEHLNN